MTGLPNVAALTMRLRTNSSPGAVVVCDLDGFKSVNDRFGHLMGNRLLEALALRFRKSCREGDFVARLGGDEFVLLLEGIGPNEINARVAQFREIVRATGRNVVQRGRARREFWRGVLPDRWHFVRRVAGGCRSSHVHPQSGTQGGHFADETPDQRVIDSSTLSYNHFMPSIDKHAPGTFCWVELGTTDHDAAKKFYGSLFGWTFVDQAMGPGEFYTIFQLGGRDCAALYSMPEAERAVVRRTGIFTSPWRMPMHRRRRP